MCVFLCGFPRVGLGTVVRCTKARVNYLTLPPGGGGNIMAAKGWISIREGRAEVCVFFCGFLHVGLETVVRCNQAKDNYLTLPPGSKGKVR